MERGKKGRATQLNPKSFLICKSGTTHKKEHPPRRRLRDFEANHPYNYDEQMIHGIGAHEEEHALRPLEDERQEEINAQKAEMRERREYGKEVMNE